uniref:Uncharacterized protein n=1 Tax=Cucumis melo TaxID=3656 RepID=A0A9I9D4L4_CUCME
MATRVTGLGPIISSSPLDPLTISMAMTDPTLSSEFVFDATFFGEHIIWFAEFV